MSSHFLSLNDWTVPPPLPVILSVLIALGFKYLGDRLHQLLFHDSREPLDAAASFVIAIAIVAALLQAVLVFWKVPVQLLRHLAWALAGLGIVELWFICGMRRVHWCRKLGSLLSEQPLAERATVFLLFAVSLCLALTALSPPTDADSLDYHLGVPLEFLRMGEAYPRYDWFHARLIGSGEVLNMLGLAGGTDILGSTLSAAALFALVAVLVSRFRAGRDRIFILSCLVSCPFLLFLLPNQKPFLLPTVANTLALLILSARFRALDARSLFLAFGCCFFAMSCKYSFLLSGGVVLLAGFAAAYVSKRRVAALGLALSLYLLIIFPMELQKFLFYGDPISPMLEGFRQHGDAALTRFAQYIRHYSMSTFPFPSSIIVPDIPGRVSAVLGLGVLTSIAALSAARRSMILVIAALVTVVISYLVGARSAGYYLEPYIWFCVAAASAPWDRYKKAVSKLLILQTAVMLLFAGYGAIRLFPGALTPGLRERVMTLNAHQYAVMSWLDEALPPDAVVLSTLRSHALMPRPFVAKDMVTWTDWTSPDEAEKTVSILQRHNFNTLIAEPAVGKEFADMMGLRCAASTVRSKEFLMATRNPWNRTDRMSLAIYGMCFASKGSMHGSILQDR